MVLPAIMRKHNITVIYYFFIILSKCIMMASPTDILLSEGSAHKSHNDTNITSTIKNHENVEQLISSTRIIGGNKATEDRHSYTVSIQYNNLHFCGGSLILKDVVLTAAHCVSSGGITNLDVLIGRHNFNENDGERIPVTRTITHPLYSSNGDASSYDIALIILASPIQDTTIQPITLNDNDSYPESGTTANVMGWGDIDPGPALITPDELHIASVEIITNGECEMITRGGQNYEGMIDESMICAYTESQDACQGDSGGPLIIRGTSITNDVQIGVVSWGVGCSYLPGVFSRVSMAYDWIKDNACRRSRATSGSSLCKTEKPTPTPSRTPTPPPSNAPTRQPSPRPSNEPSREPTPRPSEPPTNVPTREPTPRPSPLPTRQPTPRPSKSPTRRPSPPPSRKPSRQPTQSPSLLPTFSPTSSPTSLEPTVQPSESPSTSYPSFSPSTNPTSRPTVTPSISFHPSLFPSSNPSISPSFLPTMHPSTHPSFSPFAKPTSSPTVSRSPTSYPTVKPTESSKPTRAPSADPSSMPSDSPTRSQSPSSNPTWQPSMMPSSSPTFSPSEQPSRTPSGLPSSRPTFSLEPSQEPSVEASEFPSGLPTQNPTSSPSTTSLPTTSSGPTVTNIDRSIETDIVVYGLRDPLIISEVISPDDFGYISSSSTNKSPLFAILMSYTITALLVLLL